MLGKLNLSFIQQDERAINAFTVGLRRSDFVEEMDRIKPKQYQNSWMSPINLQMEKTHITTNEHDHLKMTGPIAIAIRGIDLATMTTMTLTAK
jgi:hypothetical protein